MITHIIDSKIPAAGIVVIARSGVVLANNVLTNSGAKNIHEDMGELESQVVEAAGRSALSEFREARECLARAMSAATSIASKGGK